MPRIFKIDAWNIFEPKLIILMPENDQDHPRFLNAFLSLNAISQAAPSRLATPCRAPREGRKEVAVEGGCFPLTFLSKGCFFPG